MSQSVGAVSPTSSLRLYQQSCDPRTNKQHLGDLQLQPATPACLHCNLSQMKQGPSPLSIIHTLCTHNMTIRPIHADAPFPDQSSQSASCKHAYCWIIHSFHQLGGEKSHHAQRDWGSVLSLLCLQCKTTLAQRKVHKIRGSPNSRPPNPLPHKQPPMKFRSSNSVCLYKLISTSVLFKKRVEALHVAQNCPCPLEIS